MDRWNAFHDYTTICNSAPGEILGIIALQNKDFILRRSLEIIRANLGLARQFMTLHPDHFSWFDPAAGSVAFPEWLGPGSAEEFCQGVLDLQGVMVVPGSIFEFPGNHFRVGLGRRNFPEALDHVGEYLQTL